MQRQPHRRTDKQIEDDDDTAFIGDTQSRGTWGETGHGGSWDSMNIKIRALPLDVLSYVLTHWAFRRTCAARIAKITQASCDVTT